jgi:DNA-binding LacI/PurR family transcriptional regulator
MTGKRPTHADIARIAKVSNATVSLALQSHPRISRVTRERVQAIADKLRYRPDPMLSALAAYRKDVTVPRYQGTLAWINTWSDPHRLREKYGDYWRGARERCQELGFHLEEFHLADGVMGPRRLSNILRARFIQGLLLPPQPRSRAHLHLDWANFSAITFGYTLVRPQLHSVTSAQMRCSVLAVRKLRSYGYRRIGMALSQGADERTDHNFASGFLMEQFRLKRDEQVPLLLFQNEGRAPQKQLDEWFSKYRPEAIITHTDEVAGWMRDLGHDEQKDYNLVLLAHENHQGFAGINQNNHLIGRTTIDLLTGMIHRNEKGIPQVPLRTLVEGRWIDGPSVHRKVAT